MRRVWLYSWRFVSCGYELACRAKHRADLSHLQPLHNMWDVPLSALLVLPPSRQKDLVLQASETGRFHRQREARPSKLSDHPCAPCHGHVSSDGWKSLAGVGKLYSAEIPIQFCRGGICRVHPLFRRVLVFLVGFRHNDVNARLSGKQCHKPGSYYGS